MRITDIDMNAMQVGGFGTKWLLMALSETNNQESAYDIMTSVEYPSFGYMMNNEYDNATTVCFQSK